MDLKVGDRIRPWRDTHLKIKTANYTAELILNHHQLWEVRSVAADEYRLSNTGGTVFLTYDFEKICEVFDVDTVTRGRYTEKRSNNVSYDDALKLFQK